jgi:hypothetical protein
VEKEGRRTPCLDCVDKIDCNEYGGISCALVELDVLSN